MTNIHRTTASTRPRQIGAINTPGPSADLQEVTAKLFDGLRDYPEVRRLICAILDSDSEGEPQTCKTCGRPLEPEPAREKPPRAALLDELKNRQASQRTPL